MKLYTASTINDYNPDSVTLKVDGRRGKVNHVWFQFPDGTKVEMSPDVALKLAAQIKFIATRTSSRSVPPEATPPEAHELHESPEGTADHDSGEEP